MRSFRDSLVALFEAANPGFAISVLGATIAVGTYAAVASVGRTRYLHLVVGLVWTGCNLLLGLVVGPTLSRVDDRTAADVYSHAAPRLAVLLPALLAFVVGIGLPLAVQMHLFPHAGPWLAVFGFVDLTAVLVAFGWQFDVWGDPRWRGTVALVALASAGLLAGTRGQIGMTLTSMLLTLVVGSAIVVTGFGVILAGNVRAALEARAENPDHAHIAALGRRNTTLARVQVLLQVVIVISVL